MLYVLFMKLSQIVKFVVKKKVIKLFRLRLKFRPRRTQTNLIEKLLKTLEASQRFDSLFRPVLFSTVHSDAFSTILVSSE